MKQLHEYIDPSPPDKTEETSDKLVANDICIGVEVELENVYNVDFVPGWHVVEDGSLRGGGGREYVFATPRNGNDITKALNALDMGLSIANPSAGPDTSLHVHLDVTTLTKQQLAYLISASYIFEQVLIASVAPERLNNPFCTTAVTNNDQIDQAANAIARVDKERQPRTTKYVATNLSNLERFGTVEYRAHPGIKSVDEIYSWVNLLFKLYKFATELQQPPTIELKGMRYNEAIRHVFGYGGDVTLVQVADCAMLYKQGMQSARYFQHQYRRQLKQVESWPERVKGESVPPKYSTDFADLELYTMEDVDMEESERLVQRRIEEVREMVEHYGNGLPVTDGLGYFTTATAARNVATTNPTTFQGRTLDDVFNNTAGD